VDESFRAQGLVDGPGWTDGWWMWFLFYVVICCENMAVIHVAIVAIL
jgi:hypothetical protein